MEIEVFWIVLTAVLYIVMVVYILVGHHKYRQLKNDLIDALHKKAEIGNFLSTFSKNLKTVKEIENSMKTTSQYVADLIGASSICIFILDNDGFLVPSGIAGEFPPLHCASDYVFTKPRYILESLKQEKIRIGEGFVGEVAQNRKASLIEDAIDDPRFSNLLIEVRTIMAVPMVTEGQVAGVICAVNNSHTGRAFSPEQFSALKFIAGQVILAHNIVQVYSNLSKQQRISQELNFAKQLQASLTPEHAPKYEQCKIYAFTKSAKEVSGDFYDFVDIDENRRLIVIGDACGKGIPACMLMAMTRSFIRASAERFTSLHDLMKGLNNDLFRDTGDERFVTVACCLLDKRAGTIEYARAGHTELLIGREGHKVRQIFPDGAAFGLLPPDIVGDYDLITFSFLKDMFILLFSDGITEALNSAGREFGLPSLIKIFNDAVNLRKTPREMVEMIIREVNKFAGDAIQADDQTVVVIQGR